MTREQLFAAFFFAVFLFLLYELYRIFAGFLGPLAWAAILALTFYPFYQVACRLLRYRRNLAALLLTLIVTLLVVLPAFALGSLITREAVGAYHRLESAVRSGEAQGLLNRLEASRAGMLWDRLVAPRLGEASVDVTRLALRAANAVSTFLMNQAAGIARNLFGFAVNFIIMVVALFFFFRDGERMVSAVRDLIPMEPAHKDQVLRRLYETTSAVVQSMLATAVAQGVLAALGFWLIGRLNFSALLGVASGIFSFIPLAGPAAVWVPCAVALSLTGYLGRGVALGVYGLTVVSSVDNIIKPLVIGGRAQLPTFLLLFAIFGGLRVYGFLGLFLGPVLLATLLAFVNIYREQYRVAASPPPPPAERPHRHAG